MRMMGTESVEYHRATVLGRADDHPGMAMEYYASRGETSPVPQTHAFATRAYYHLL